MAKSHATRSSERQAFICSECGTVNPKWQGQCSSCGSWNSLIDTVLETRSLSPSSRTISRATASPTVVQKLSDIAAREITHHSTGIEEFDRVLGGGWVAGGVILIGGDPGIGKSTLLLQALANMAQAGAQVLYVSGEESGEQIAARSRRLQIPMANLQFMSEINLERILNALETTRPAIAVIDSIQTVWTEVLNSASGSVAQVRECAAQLTRFAKLTETAMVLVGHVTKDGALAGPRVLEHIVDTVLYFEGDTHSSFRLIRAWKNRFGTVNELGVFGMTDHGLRGVSNPSALFLSQHLIAVPGSCIMVTQEGTRPLLVEVQALVDTSHTPNPRRLAVGIDGNRLAILLAVLHRHCAIACFDQDVFINVVGGLRIQEPAADLAVLLAIVSSLQGRSLPKQLATFGEVGLAGEIRPAPRGQERLREAAKLGFKKVLAPKANIPSAKKLAVDPILKDMEIIPLERIETAIDFLRQEH